MTVKNIINVYNQSSDEDIQQGHLWYKDANKIAEHLAIDYRMDISVTCAVIAVLSPRLRWEQNIFDAEALIDAFYHGGYARAIKTKSSAFKANKMKAIDIMLGEYDLESFYKVEERKSGLKVASFANCIRYPDDSNCVCIDVHATSIWVGERITKQNVYNITPKRYAVMSEDYRTAAQKLQMAPMDLQAITWVTWRRLLDI